MKDGEATSKKSTITIRKSTVSLAGASRSRQTMDQSIRARRLLSARERYELIKQSEIKMDEDGAFATQSRTSYASVGERCILWCAEKAQNLSKNSLMHIFLLMMILLYTISGAIMFEAIEGDNEKKLFLTAVESKHSFFQALRELQNEPNLKPSNPVEFDQKVFSLMREHSDGVNLCMKPRATNWEDVEIYHNPWSFWNGIIFSATTYSTIGYGNLVPKTSLGRATAIVYAIAGIPLFLTFLAHLGIVLTKWIKRFWGWVRRCYFTGTGTIRQEKHVQKAVNTMNEFYERRSAAMNAVPESYSDLEDSDATDEENYEEEKSNKSKEKSDRSKEKSEKTKDRSKERMPEKHKDKDKDKDKPLMSEKSRVRVVEHISNENLPPEQAPEPVDDQKGLPAEVTLKGKEPIKRPWHRRSKDHLSDSLGSTISISSSVSSTISSSVLFEDEFHLPITLSIFILVAYIFLGAAAYMFFEKWTYIDSIYFVFASMATIGYGDLVPGHPILMVCSIGYLVFGLSLTAMCIHVAKIKINASFARARDRLGERIGIEV